jgi:hypothetical protein
MADRGSGLVALDARSVYGVLIEVAMLHHERVLIVDSDCRSIHQR